MNNPLYDPDLDDLPARPSVGRPAALGEKSGKAATAYPKDVDSVLGGEKGRRSSRGGAGWFASLSTTGLIAFSLALGLAFSVPIALVLQPELRRPWPWYHVSAVVALVG